MKRNNRIIVILILAAFVLNTIVSDLAFGLAPSYRSDDIAGIEIKDAFRISWALEQELTKLEKHGPLNTETLREALTEERISENTPYKPADIQLFLNNFKETRHGLYITPTIKDRYGVRTYHVLFYLTKNKEGKFPVEIYSEKEKSAIDADMMPEKIPSYTKALGRYTQHKNGQDAVIEYAHKNGLARSPEDKMFYNRTVMAMLRHLNIKVSNPKKLTPIEEREFYLVKTTPEIKKMMLDLPRTKVVGADGREYDVRYMAHSSNGAVHVFVSEQHFDLLTNLKGQSSSEELPHAVNTIRMYIAHEIGVMLGLLPYEFKRYSIGEDGYDPLNEVDARYLQFSKDVSSKFPKLTLNIANLDTNLKTRDYAAGKIPQPITEITVRPGEMVPMGGNYYFMVEEIIKNGVTGSIVFKADNKKVPVVVSRSERLVKKGSLITTYRGNIGVELMWVKGAEANLKITNPIKPAQLVAFEAEEAVISDRVKDLRDQAIAQCVKLLPEGAKNGEKMLREALVEDVEAYRYCMNNNLPLTLTFDPSRSKMAKTYKNKSPFRVSVTVYDDGSLVVTSVNSCSGKAETTLAKGGCRWYQFDEYAKFASKSGEVLAESGRLAEAMGDKNPLWDVFFDGGKTVFLAKSGADKEKMIRTWVGSSIASGMLCGLYVAGPDMDMGETEMTWIQDEAEKRFKEEVIKDKVLKKLGKDSILATTSRPESMGSLPHMPWMVTSLGVVTSLGSVLSDKQALEHHGIKLDEQNKTVIIQGFGDVGSGIVKLLLTTYKKLGFKVVGVSDIHGAIYSEKGLDENELMRLRNRFEAGEKFKLTEAYRAGDVERYEGEPNAVLYKECTALILAAGSNIFTKTKDNTKLIKAKLIVEGANNAFESGLENQLHGMGVLYIPGPVANGGGIYTSTEEVIHFYMAELKGLKDHVLNAIADYSASITKSILEIYKETEYSEHPYKIMQMLSEDIRLAKKQLLEEGRTNLAVARRADVYVKRGLPEKYALIIAASEIAHDKIYYAGVNVADAMEKVDRLAGSKLAEALFELSRAVSFKEEPDSDVRLELKKKLIGMLYAGRPDVLRRVAAEALSYVCEGMLPENMRDAVLALEKVRGENGEVGTWAQWSLDKLHALEGISYGSVRVPVQSPEEKIKEEVFGLLKMKKYGDVAQRLQNLTALYSRKANVPLYEIWPDTERDESSLKELRIICDVLKKTKEGREFFVSDVYAKMSGVLRSRLAISFGLPVQGVEITDAAKRLGILKKLGKDENEPGRYRVIAVKGWDEYLVVDNRKERGYYFMSSGRLLGSFELDEPAILRVSDLKFALNIDTLKTAAGKFRADLENRGKEGSSLSDIVTKIGIPTGQEAGEYLFIDLGGTNLRVGLVEFQGNGKIVKKDEISRAVPKNIINGGGDTLFRLIADRVKEFTEKNRLTGELKVGFTFSFAMRKEGVNRGIITPECNVKGWNFDNLIEQGKATGVEPEVVTLLHEELRNINLSNVKVVALVNDTEGVRDTGAYMNSKTIAGGVLGTGHNTAIRDRYGRSVNLESGAFDKLLMDLDNAEAEYLDMLVDNLSEKPTVHPLEKKLSGKYIGPLFGLTLEREFKSNGLFREHKGLLPDIFRDHDYEKEECKGFSGENLSDIENAWISGGAESVKAYLTGLGIVNPSDLDAQRVRDVAHDIMLRSAQLAAATFAGIVMEREGTEAPRGEYVYAVDGPLLLYPGYKKMMEDTLSGIFGKAYASKLEVLEAKDGAGIGAAITAMIVSTQAETQAPEIRTAEKKTPSVLDMIMSMIPAEWLNGWLGLAGFAEALKIANYAGGERIKPNDDSVLIFSEKVTFGERKSDGTYEEGLGVLLPNFIKSDARVAVIASTPKQEALIDELNADLPENMQIVCAGSIAEARSKAQAARYYYVKTEAEADAGIGGVTNISIIVKKIIDAIGQVVGIADGAVIQKMHDAALRFAQSA